MLLEIQVAIGQIDVQTLAPEANLKKILCLMEEIKDAKKGIDLIVFPESANIGYIEDFEDEIYNESLVKSEDLSGPFISSIRNMAKKLDIHIVIGMSRLDDEKSKNRLFNSSILIDNEGYIVGVYDKIHLFRNEKKIFETGSKISVYQTGLAKMGLSICYDMSFPEMSRILAIKGADIICSIFNGRDDKPYKSKRIEYLARARAYENNVFIILANRVGTEKKTPFVGHSLITGPNGEIITQSFSREEEIVYGVIRRQSLFDERNENFILNDRRPDVYQHLCTS